MAEGPSAAGSAPPAQAWVNTVARWRMAGSTWPGAVEAAPSRARANCYSRGRGGSVGAAAAEGQGGGGRCQQRVGVGLWLAAGWVKGWGTSHRGIGMLITAGCGSPKQHSPHIASLHAGTGASTRMWVLCRLAGLPPQAGRQGTLPALRQVQRH